MGFFEKIKQGLTKTKEAMSASFGGIFASFQGVDDDFYDELEESLILADLGVDTAVKAVTRLREVVKERKLRSADEVKQALREILTETLTVGDPALNIGSRRQRRGQNHHHRQAGKPAPFGGQPGFALCGRYLPRRSRRPA